MLSLTEPILVPTPAGPFTLYQELSCKVELEVEIPRDVVKTQSGTQTRTRPSRWTPLTGVSAIRTPTTTKKPFTLMPSGRPRKPTGRS